VTTINKKVAGIAAVGAAALAIGFGISSAAQADDATPAPSPTTQSGPNGSNGNGDGNGNGRGWGAGGKHGMGGMGAFGGDLSELASKLGVDEAQLRDAMAAVRDDLKDELKGLRGAAKDDPNVDRQAFRDQMQQKLADALAAELGIDSSKVRSALEDLEAAREAERDQALTDRLDQAVKDGKLTQAEADAVKKAVDAGVIGGGPGMGLHLGRGQR
jgi:hypothetical protein